MCSLARYETLINNLDFSDKYERTYLGNISIAQICYYDGSIKAKYWYKDIKLNSFITLNKDARVFGEFIS